MTRYGAFLYLKDTALEDPRYFITDSVSGRPREFSLLTLPSLYGVRTYNTYKVKVDSDI
jgi:hypothetical protein